MPKYRIPVLINKDRRKEHSVFAMAFQHGAKSGDCCCKLRLQEHHGTAWGAEIRDQLCRTVSDLLSLFSCYRFLKCKVFSMHLF